MPADVISAERKSLSEPINTLSLFSRAALRADLLRIVPACGELDQELSQSFKESISLVKQLPTPAVEPGSVPKAKSSGRLKVEQAQKTLEPRPSDGGLGVQRPGREASNLLSPEIAGQEDETLSTATTPKHEASSRVSMELPQQIDPETASSAASETTAVRLDELACVQLYESIRGRNLARIDNEDAMSAKSSDTSISSVLRFDSAGSATEACAKLREEIAHLQQDLVALNRFEQEHAPAVAEVRRTRSQSIDSSERASVLSGIASEVGALQSQSFLPPSLSLHQSPQRTLLERHYSSAADHMSVSTTSSKPRTPHTPRTPVSTVMTASTPNQQLMYNTESPRSWSTTATSRTAGLQDGGRVVRSHTISEGDSQDALAPRPRRQPLCALKQHPVLPPLPLDMLHDGPPSSRSQHSDASNAANTTSELPLSARSGYSQISTGPLPSPRRVSFVDSNDRPTPEIPSPRDRRGSSGTEHPPAYAPPPLSPGTALFPTEHHRVKFAEPAEDDSVCSGGYDRPLMTPSRLRQRQIPRDLLRAPSVVYNSADEAFVFQAQAGDFNDESFARPISQAAITPLPPSPPLSPVAHTRHREDNEDNDDDIQLQVEPAYSTEQAVLERKLRQITTLTEEQVRMVIDGDVFLKVPFNKGKGATAQRRVFIIDFTNPAAAVLRWRPVGKRVYPSHTPLTQVRWMCFGALTTVMKKRVKKDEASRCFTLVCKQRTVDVIAASTLQAVEWYLVLQTLLHLRIMSESRPLYTKLELLLKATRTRLQIRLGSLWHRAFVTAIKRSARQLHKRR